MNELVLKDAGDTYSSISMVDAVNKGALVNAMLGNGTPLRDIVGKVIKIKDVFIQMIEIADENGEYFSAPKIVLIDVDGFCYSCTSGGVLTALKTIMAIYGMPTWEEGVSVMVCEKTTTKKRKILTLEVK